MLKENLTRGLLAGALPAVALSCPVQTIASGQEGGGRGVAITLTSIGHSYKELGKREQAAEHYRRAGKLYEEMGDKNSVNYLKSLVKSLKL